VTLQAFTFFKRHNSLYKSIFCWNFTISPSFPFCTRYTKYFLSMVLDKNVCIFQL